MTLELLSFEIEIGINPDRKKVKKGDILKTYAALLFVILLSLTSCDDSDSDRKSDVTIRGIASAEDSLTGAAIEVFNDRGDLLYHEEDATDDSGTFSVTLDRIPETMYIQTSGGRIDGMPFHGTLSAVIDEHNTGNHSFYSLNPATSVLAETRRTYPDIAPETAEAEVRACLHIDKSIDLLTDFHFYLGEFNAAAFFDNVESAHGFDAYVKQLAFCIHKSINTGEIVECCLPPRLAAPHNNLKESSTDFIIEELAKGALNQVGGEFAGWALNSIINHPENDPLDEEIQQGFKNLSNRLANIQANVIALKTEVNDLKNAILATLNEVKKNDYNDLFNNTIWPAIIELKALHNELYEFSIRSDLGSSASIQRAKEIQEEIASLNIRKDLMILQESLATKNGIENDLDALIDFYGKASPCDYDKFEKALTYFFHYQVIALNLLLEDAHSKSDDVHAQQHIDFFTGAAKDSNSGMDAQMAMYHSWVEKIMLCSAYDAEWTQPNGIAPSSTVLRMQKLQSQLLLNSGLEFEVWVRMRGLNYAPGVALILQDARPGYGYDETLKCWGIGTNICSQQTGSGQLLEDSTSNSQSETPVVTGFECSAFKNSAVVYRNIYPTLEPGTYKFFNQYDYYNDEGDDPSHLGECYFGRTTWQYNYLSDRFMNHTITILEGDYISNLMVYLYEERYRVIDVY